MTISGSLDATPTGDGVEFRFVVTNTGDDAVELTFPDGMDADLAVFAGEDVAVRMDGVGMDGDESGTHDAPAWRWSDDRLFTQAIRHEALEPGESLLTEFEWSDPDSGTHTGVATLQARDHDCEADTTVSV